MKKLNLTLSGMLAIGICAVALTQSGAPELRKIDADPIDLSKVKIASQQQSASAKKVNSRSIGEVVDSISFNEGDYTKYYEFNNHLPPVSLSDGIRVTTNDEGTCAVLLTAPENYFEQWISGGSYRCKLTISAAAGSQGELLAQLGNVEGESYRLIENFDLVGYTINPGEESEIVFYIDVPTDNKTTGATALLLVVDEEGSNNEVDIRNITIERIETGNENWIEHDDPVASYDSENGWYTFECKDVTYAVYEFYGDDCEIYGIKTDRVTAYMPERVVFEGKTYDITGLNTSRSDFYIDCPYLKTIEAPSLKNIEFHVNTGCVLERINTRQLQSLDNNTYGLEGQFGTVVIYSALPYGFNIHDSAGGCVRPLVGQETLDAPVEPVGANFWTLDENGSYIGYCCNNPYDDYENWNLYVQYIYSAGNKASIPEKVTFNDKYSDYQLEISVNSIDNYYELTEYAPKLTALHVPVSMRSMNVYWSRTSIRNIYFEGQFDGNLPQLNYNLNSNITVYASSEDLYDALQGDNSYRNASIVPYGWDFEPLVVEVKRRGEFAQTYIELTDADWSAGKVVKVIGSLSENDLKNMTNLTAVSTLDLSEADFDALPDSWMNGKTTLTKVVLPDFVTNIPNSAFNGCYALREVVCPSLAYVGNYAFNNCRNLESIDLSNVYFIGNNAFSSCNALTEVNTTDALSYIGTYAFRETGITRFDVPEKVTNLTDYVFYGCSALAEVSLPSSLVNIGAYTFASTAISGINVPEGVATIGDYCFNNCRNLENVALPSTLTDVGSYMFTNCTSLMNVDCKAITPPAVNYDMTSGVNLNRCTLRVAPFAIPEYRENSVWGKFLIVKPLNEPISNIVVERRMSFDLLSEDNDVLAGNPTMILKYNASKSRYGQLTAAGDGTLSAGQFTMWAYLGTRDGSMNYSASLINNAENMRADNVTLSMQVNKNYWHFFSLPFDVAMSDVTANEGTDFVIRRYDSERRAAQGETTTGNNWVDVLPDETLEAGQGYIIMAANNTTSASGGYYNAYVTFNSGNTLTKNNIFRSGNYIANLKEYPAEFAHNRSWNFIGNPYPCFYRLNNLMDDFYQPVTIWRGSSYQAYSPIDDDVVLRPFEAFFVQCPLETTEMAFSADGRMHVEEAFGIWATPGHRAPERINASERRVFNFNVSGMGSDDRARIVINPDADRAYDAGDAAKMFADNSTSVEMYVADGVSYAICERPLDDAAATLGVKVAAKGQYTVSLDSRNADGWKVILIDNLTGNIVDLSAAPYIFDAEEGDFADRFTVRFEADGLGIGSIIADDAEVAVYNLQGIKVYEGLIRDFNGDKGIYVVVCGENSFKIEL